MSCHAQGDARHRCDGSPTLLYRSTRHGLPTGNTYSLCARGLVEWLADAAEHGEPEWELVLCEPVAPRDDDRSPG